MILRDVRDSKGFGGIFKDFNRFQYTLMVLMDFQGFKKFRGIFKDFKGF